MYENKQMELDLLYAEIQRLTNTIHAYSTQEEKQEVMQKQRECLMQIRQINGTLELLGDPTLQPL